MSTSESSDDSPIRPKKIFSETPAMAIKRFSIVDSSEEEEELKNQFNDSSLLNALETNPNHNHNHQNSSTDLKGSSELLKDEHGASYYDEGDKVVQKKEETSSSSSSSVAMDLSFLRKGKEDPKQPSEDSVPSIHQEDSSPVQPPSPPKEAEQIRKEEQKDQQSVKESTTKSSTEHSDKGYYVCSST
ncbi:hypothetical protein ADEAN_000859300 [Angomonas deanei]|uniref:Uncharacterized protein n=1 Tax=Angomonas deanei TaxID=59799 RepID=A0A7G2CS83_9TRYP|nr:hypothetical protein ADEAN_000859300 [Angomonas deanei]